jgi:hypothetical protein
MSDYLFDLSFGKNDEELRQKSTRFKMKKDEIARVSLAWWPTSENGNPDLDAENPHFKAARRLYHEKVGYFFDKGPEYQKLSGNGEPGRINLATIIIVWPLDDEGNIDKQKFIAGKFQILYWIFSKNKYEEMARRHRKRSLGKHDLEILCKEEQFQQMGFDTYEDSMLRRIFESDKEGMKKFQDRITSTVARLAANIESELGKDLDLDELRSRISGEEVSAVNESKAVSEEDVDDMVNNFLED